MRILTMVVPIVGCIAPRIDAPTEVVFDVEQDRFAGDGIGAPGVTIFDVTTADMDLDGDLDVLLNRHLDHPMELYANDGQAFFTQSNRKGTDATGLWDNPDIPDLFAEAAVMEPAVEAQGDPGVYVWHELARNGRWWLVVVPDGAPVSLHVVVNRPLETIEGVAGAELDWIDEHTADLVVPDGPPRTIRIENELIGTQLRLEQTATALPFFAGATLARFDQAVLDLWKDDPHGMAWIDVLGSAEPDLVVNRGGLIGQLLPPQDPKRDRLFEFTGGETTYAFRDDVLPPNYGRGRQLAWADVDGDGAPELYAANTDTASHLWDFEDGLLVDRAQLGLALVGDDTFAWLDIDEDGRLDLISAAGRDIRVLLQRDPMFQEQPGASVGLSWPADAVPDDDGIFNPLSMQLLDVDRDGDLDLVATDDDLIRLFRFHAGHFTDEGQAGLPSPGGWNAMMPMDVDADGWMDVVVASGDVRIGRNLGGTFETQDLQLGLGHTPVAVPGDFDGNGTVDLVLFHDDGGVWLSNRTPGEAVEFTPDAPPGSVVRAAYDDGTVLAQPWGATAISRYSQGTRPLRFAADGLLSLTVQPPG